MKCNMARHAPTSTTGIISAASSALHAALELLCQADYSNEVTTERANEIVDRLCRLQADLHENVWSIERKLRDDRDKGRE